MANVNRMTPAEQREQEEVMAVALAQPHRQGNQDPRLESALGRLCAAHRLGDHCYRAGVEYRNIVLESLRAQGLPVLGWAPGSNGYDAMDPEQLMARKELARRRERDADLILIGLGPRLPRIMADLCYRDYDQPLAGLLIRLGLAALSDAWGMTPRRFGAA